jgi:polysaccharide export outer membrane protein
MRSQRDRIALSKVPISNLTSSSVIDSVVILGPNLDEAVYPIRLVSNWLIVLQFATFSRPRTDIVNHSPPMVKPTKGLGRTGMRWLKSLLLLIIVVAPLAACASMGAPATYLVQTKGPYQLDTGDVVRVSVYGDAELTKTYKVDDGGSISFPLVGSVEVRGMTTQMAAAGIARALANGYMRNPDVAVEIDTYRPFFIQGAVKTAGQFTYVYGMTVRAAISTAGGYSETADRAQATIYRRQGKQMVKGTVSLDFPIYPGDTIVIAERWL